MKKKARYFSILFIAFYFTTLLLGNMPSGVKVNAEGETKVNNEKEIIEEDVTFLKSILDKIFKVGDITVISVDEEGNELFRKKEKRLKYKTYRLDANEIEGYELVGNDNNKFITLDKNNPYSTVIFNYKNDTREGHDGDSVDRIKEINDGYSIVSVDEDMVEENPSINVEGIVDTENKDDEINIENQKDEIVSDEEIKKENGTEIKNENENFNISENIYEKENVPLTGNVSMRDDGLNFTRVEVGIGVITIKYVEANTGYELYKEVFNDLSYGEYTYGSKEFKGYALKGEGSKTVTITDKNYKQEIVFEYEKNVVELNENQVPYISSYYVTPIVKPGEDVLIDFYVTDYFHTEYLENESDEYFTITVKIEGKDDIVIKNVKPGDNQVNLGKFKEEKEYKYSILATDWAGRNSHELFNFFLVRGEKQVKEYKVTKEDLIKYNIKNQDMYEEIVWVNIPKADANTTKITELMNKAYNEHNPKPNTYTSLRVAIDGKEEHNTYWKYNRVKYAADYSKDAVLEESRNTRSGLQKLLDDKAAEGYNKITLLNGIYRIDHEKAIYMPSDLTLDLNGATIKQNQFAGDSSLMLTLNNTYDSHVINGIFDGDYYTHDYVNSSNNSEWVQGITIGGESKYSSFEDLIVQNITGYGGGNGIANSRNGDKGYTYIYPRGVGKFTSGDIDRETGNSVENNKRTTSDFVDIKEYQKKDVDYIQIGKYLGYQGNPCGTWNIIAHFYDENKNYIESIDGYLYRRIGIPENANFVKVTILNNAYPTDISVYSFRMPTHCAFKKVKFINCRCVGLAQAAMKDMLVEDCEFSYSGQSSAKCAYDAEDGWDLMQDATFRRLNFYNSPGNEFLTCGGHNFVVEDMVKGRMYIWERTRSLVVRNNKNTSINLQSGGKENIVRHGIYRVYGNEFTGGTVANNLAKNNVSLGPLNGKVIDSELYGLVSGGDYKNCTIIATSSFLGYISTLKMVDCTFITSDDFNGRYNLSFNGGRKEDIYFENCEFKGKSTLLNNNNFYSAVFKNCTFEDTLIKPSVLANEDDKIYFENCKMGYSGSNFIYYSPHAYTKGTYSQIEFKDCEITNLDNNTNSFLYAYSKPNGYLKFTDCNINIPNGLTIFSGYPTNNNFIENYTVNFTNTKLPEDIKLVDDYFSTNSNLKINVN